MKVEQLDKTGYCPTCGASLWTGVDHVCDPSPPTPSVHQMIAALVLADDELSGEDAVEPGRARAAVRRVVWALNLSDNYKLFACRIQSTAEACSPGCWDEIS